RVKNSRIKKESAIKAYWRRILCKFIDMVGHGINNGAELNIQNIGRSSTFKKKT
ncbi:uncharacterized protein K441DRAFT_594461, partial [Cenococcum geophilum 1.58]